MQGRENSTGRSHIHDWRILWRNASQADLFFAEDRQLHAVAGAIVSDPRSPLTINQLTQMWERVLKTFPVGPDDNFFDLGGNDMLADSLFAEIAKIDGRVLPSATICRAPTIHALSSLLATPTLPRFSPFVPLKAGRDKPPIIIAHGLGGRASFSQLAKHIGTSNPVYGIQAKGVDGLEEPLDRIEDMSEFYLDALTQLQPHGPYILIGYSFGGLVALEMAQQLIEHRENIALLMLVDTYPHSSYLAPGKRLKLFARKVAGHISDVRREPLRSLSRFTNVLQRRLPTAKSQDTHSVARGISSLSLVRTTARVKESDLVAMRYYQPRYYRGKITYVRPETNPYLPADPASIWKKLAAEFEIETVPGDHLGMIGTHFESLAAVLTRHVENASAALPAAESNRLARKMSL
jgi:acetoacetyl-CoA synthetase